MAHELTSAVADAVAAWSSISPGQADWRGLRSNGSAFTITTLGQYYAHDIVHHAGDVRLR